MKIKSTTLITPEAIESLIPNEFVSQVADHRQQIKNIIDGKDKRKLIVVGPCSIHSITEAIDYGQRLVKIQKECPHLMLVMRVYFEKPRTTVGWKGLVNDPDMDGSFKIEKGLMTARALCMQLLALGLPLATEVLDPFTIRYLSNIFSWVAIGARTTESQTHREIASGLPMAVGFKNGTAGQIDIALNAMKSAQFAHNYLGVDHSGHISRIEADGNDYGHIILRGGTSGPNWYSEDILKTFEATTKAMNKNIPVMVDCSHANCEGDYTKQVGIGRSVFNAAYKLDRMDQLLGLMIESHINEGSQSIGQGALMEYGVSVTDKCIDIESTRDMLVHLNDIMEHEIK